MTTRKQIKDLEDANASAFKALRHVIQTTEGEKVKNPAAVALGRLGASKGGKARAKALTKDERKAIAKKGATARWGDSEKIT